ncbi:phosphatase PAP2 family protein, partial [Arcobacter cryaerophilus gv. occultus]
PSAVISTCFFYVFTIPYDQQLLFSPGIMNDGAHGILMSYRY